MKINVLPVSMSRLLILIILTALSLQSYADDELSNGEPSNDEQSLSEGIAAYRANDYQKARNILQTLADNDNSKAMLFLGHLYAYGNDPKLFDPFLAQKLYKQAAQKGEAEAQYQVGLLILLQLGGDEVTLEFQTEKWNRAYPYMLAAATQGHAGAQLMLGDYNYVGYGKIRMDEKQAFRWSYKAAIRMSKKDKARTDMVNHWLSHLQRDSSFLDSLITKLVIRYEEFFSQAKIVHWPTPDCPLENCARPHSLSGESVDLYFKRYKILYDYD